MIYRKPQFYDKFRCLGGDCPLTCCRDWEIVLDEAALEDYSAAPSPLREVISGNLVTDEEGDVCFRLRADGLCALLDGDGLCPIQRRWGEEHLCAHCAAYPRFIEEYGSLTEACQAISCPEAARLVLEEGVFPLTEEDDGGDDRPFDGVDGELLAGLLHSRREVFDLLSRRELSIWSRLSALLEYAGYLQDYIDLDAPLEAVPPPEPLQGAPSLQALADPVIHVFEGLDPLRPEWPAFLRDSRKALKEMPETEYDDLTEAYQAACPRWELHLERLACYLVFRHWPKVVNDDDLYGRANLTVAACVLLYHLSLLRFRARGDLPPKEESLLYARFSREVEHLEENFFAAAGALTLHRTWSIEELL